MNTIIIELCAEDRARLDKIYEALTHGITPAEPTKAEEADHLKQLKTLLDKAEEKIEDPQLTFEEVYPEAPTTEATEPQEEPKAETPTETKAEPTATKDDIRKLVVMLSTKGKKAEARDIVMAHGTSITDLPDAALDTVFEQLKELEG